MKREVLVIVLSLAFAASVASPALAGGPAKDQSLNPSEMGQPVWSNVKSPSRKAWQAIS